MGSAPVLVVSQEPQCSADQTYEKKQDGAGAGQQPPRRPQEEDEADEGGDGEVQGGERGHGSQAPGRDPPARGGEFATHHLPVRPVTTTRLHLCKNLTRPKSFLVRRNPLKPSFCCRDLWHAAAPASAVAAGVGPWLVWWDESEWDSGFEPVPSRQQLKSRSPPEDCHVAWMLRATRRRTNTLIPKCPKKGIRPPHRHRADAIVGG